MKRQLSGLILSCAGLILSGCGSASFKEYESKEHKFKAMFPGTPKIKNQDAGGFKQTYYMVETRNGAFSVIHQDMPPVPEAMARFVLNKSKDALNALGKVKNSSDIVLESKHPGVEVHADVTNPKDAETKVRIYLVNNILYQVMVLGNPSFVNSADATKFLDSFKYAP